MTDPVARLKEWFDNKARPFLEQHETDKVVELDQNLDNPRQFSCSPRDC